MLLFVAGLLLSSGDAAMARTLRLVALGDSLTAGYGLPPRDALPAALERTLKARGRAVEIENAGVSGDTSSGGLARVDWSVPDGVDGVILALGANDALRGVDPEVTRRALDETIRRLKARGISVMLVGMYAPRSYGEDYVRRFDSIYPDLAREHGLVLHPFILEGVAGEPRLNLPDGIHPTAEGVRLMAQGMAPHVELFLGRIASGS
jgi:acyl-CoA thioesterase-1